MESNEAKLLGLIEKAVQKNLSKGRTGLLFSGGLDSVIIALVLKRVGIKFTCFFSYLRGIGEPKDLAFAKKAAKALGLKLETSSITLEQLPSLLQETCSTISSTGPVQVGVALPLMLACKSAKKAGVKTVFTGMGADELFCGYAKFKESKRPTALSKKLLKSLYQNDLPRDKAIAKKFGLFLKTPYLASTIQKFALALPKSQKLSSSQNKIILRKLALFLNLCPELAQRKKLAAQYGSNFDKAIEKLARKAGKSKSSYLQSFQKPAVRASQSKGLKKPALPKPKIAALFSGGKDSCLALWKMQQNFPIACLISVIPKNEDSFMYHKPSLKILRLQSKALGIPLLTEKTLGLKEKELSALRKALANAKKRFGIEGVVSGALYSSYQRKRIQKICNSLSLKLFSPLWHMGQEAELKEFAEQGFVFIMVKIAGLGLGKEWLGRSIGKREIAQLGSLEKKFGFNVAGEGGEYESLVLNAPNFSKALRIVKAKKVMENEFTGVLEIKKAVLEAKN